MAREPLVFFCWHCGIQRAGHFLTLTLMLKGETVKFQSKKVYICDTCWEMLDGK